MWRDGRTVSRPHFRVPASFAMLAALTLTLLGGLTSCDSASSPDLRSPLSARDLRRHLNFLASDELRGRRAGSGEELRAAEYVREWFALYDLVPGAEVYLQAFRIDVPVEGRVGLSSQNVIGVIPGAGALAREVVVVGAHYDHLGWSRSGDSVVVFNGADDNASGTALLLETARVMRGMVEREELRGRERRSIMFQAFGAEEIGLVGSFHFCGMPTISLEDIVAMVNFDMVGRLGANGLTLIGASSSTEWGELVDRANEEGLPIRYSSQSLNRSDQYCFYQARIPVLLFHTGLHADYHTPGDDVELLDVEGMLDVGDLAMGVLLELILRPEPPTFTGGTAVDGGRSVGTR